MRMTRLRQALILLLSLTFAAGVASAEGNPVVAPRDAHMKRYGSGWECDRGYREVDNACAVIEVPANALLGSRGRDWECARGFRRVDQSCVAVKIPPNAYLDTHGPGWRCDRGYRQVDQSCV